MRDIHGTLFLDIDGTLTVPGKKYAIERDAISAMSEFLHKGGNLVFNSGATRYRIERTVLDPLYNELEKRDPQMDVQALFHHVYLQPENGSALLIIQNIYVQENMLEFSWKRLHEMHVPQKAELRAFLEQEFVNTERYNGCLVADHLAESAGLQREYIVSLKNLPEGTPKDVITLIESMQAQHPEIDWSKIALKAARTTVDFVHRDSGKTISTQFLLQEVAGLDGPVLGFGDLGDEFASVVPTINVNQKKPNEFRLRKQPSLELNGGYELLPPDAYVSVGAMAQEKILEKSSGQEICVLRDSSGAVVYGRSLASPNGQSTITLTKPAEGNPLKIKTHETIRDAGAGTAWCIRRLLEVGYFDKEKNSKNHQ